MELIVIWIIGALIAIVVAGAKGRDEAAWAFAAILLTPLVVLVLLVLPSLKPDREAPTPDTHVRCPQCAELVRREARLCKHCRSALIPSPAPAPSAAVERAARPWPFNRPDAP